MSDLRKKAKVASRTTWSTTGDDWIEDLGDAAWDYIAAADPAKILDLMDEIETLKRTLADAREAHDMTRRREDKRFKELLALRDEVGELKEVIQRAHRVGYQHGLGSCICAVCEASGGPYLFHD